jgi:outer membrane cobalamin receptor
VELRANTADYDYYKRVGRERVENGRVVVGYDSSAANLSPEGTDISAYLAQRVRPWNALTLETGLRWDRQGHTADTQISPRLNLALALGARTTLRAAWGRYAQPHALYQLNVQDGEEAFSPAERAEQIVAGVEHKLGPGLSARVEAYRRNESDLRARYLNLSNVIEPVAEVEEDRRRFDPTGGRAQGIELFLQKHSARSSWSASYALARAYDVVNGNEVHRPLDQRHTFYVDYSIAPSPAWRLSASWQYHTGWPITAEQFRVDTLSDGDVYFTQNFSEPYGDRLPAYHRMDLRVTRDFALGRGRLSVFLDVFNLYDRDNPQSYNYSLFFNPRGLSVQRSIEPLLPRLPTVGLTWEF